MTDADLEEIFKNRSEKAEFNFIQPNILEVSDKIRTEHRSTLFDSVEKYREYREWGRETIEEWKQHL